MIKRKVATIVFYDEDNFMIQDRKKISKWGEEYGFFGGAIERGEYPEQTIKRELSEELDLDLNSNNLELFISDIKFIKEIDGEVERNVFIYKMPNLNNINVREGEIKIISRKELPSIKMVSGDLEILKRINDYLNKIK